MKAVLGVILSLAVSSPLLAAPPTLEQRVQILERKVGTISDLLLRLDTLQREVQQLRGEVELQNHTMDALKKRQRDLYLDVDQRLSQINAASTAPTTTPSTVTPEVVRPGQATQPQAATVMDTAVATAPTAGTGAPISTPAGGAVPVQPQVPAGDPAKEDASYQAAFKLLMQRRYDEAKVAFSTFLASYPSGSYADNAQYWLAEASYVTRQFDTALQDFSKVIELYPQSPKVPDALLKTGFIQYEQKAWPESRATLEGIVKRYPNSTASRLAKKRLNRMRSEGR